MVSVGDDQDRAPRGADPRVEVELGVSDPSVLSALQRWATAAADTEVARIARRPGPGEQGAAEVLAAVASSSSVVALIRMLPEFLRARRSDLKITLRVADRELTVTAANVTDVTAIIDTLLKT